MENITEVTARVLQGPFVQRLSLQTHESESAIRRGVEQAVPISSRGWRRTPRRSRSAGPARDAARGQLSARGSRCDRATTGEPGADLEPGSIGLGVPARHSRQPEDGNRSRHGGRPIRRQQSYGNHIARPAAPVVLDALGKEAVHATSMRAGCRSTWPSRAAARPSAMPAATSGMFGEAREGVYRAKASMAEARERLRTASRSDNDARTSKRSRAASVASASGSRPCSPCSQRFW